VADPVQRLGEALNQAHAGNAEVDASCAEVHSAAFALLDALPDLLQAARNAGFELGYNDWRASLADELARETREQGFYE